jgi:hypothetical protein
VRLPAGAILDGDSTRAGTAAAFIHLPAECGGLDIEGVNEFSCRDELAAVVEIGAELGDHRRQ